MPTIAPDPNIGAELPQAVAALIGAVSTYDWDVSRHLLATSALACRVAERLELDPEQIETCRLAAMVHDVGMLGITSSVINQPSMLAEPEWDMLTEHPALGAELLVVIPSLAHLAPIVRAHHERMDGTGYPDMLIGGEIPLAARVIAVVDAFHTMTVPTAYRSAGSTQAAICELAGNAGSQFDPRVVEALCRCVGSRQRLRRA